MPTGISAGIAGLTTRRQIKREQKFNASQALLDREFQSAEAQKQMDFQAAQSSTQYQRAAADLEKAGLNRILALGSPAASAQGARAAGSRASYSGPNVAANMASAHQAANQAKLTQEQTRLTSAQADKAEFTRLPYKYLNDVIEGFKPFSANSAVQKGKAIKGKIGQIFDDVKDYGNLWKARHESLKQRAYNQWQKRDRKGGDAPITTIHLTNPKGK